MKKIGIMVLLVLGTATLCFAETKIFGVRPTGISFMTLTDGPFADSFNSKYPSITSQGNAVFFNMADDEAKSKATAAWALLISNIGSGKSKIKGGTDLSGGTTTEEIEISVVEMDGNTLDGSERKVTDLTEATLYGTAFFGEEK